MGLQFSMLEICYIERTLISSFKENILSSEVESLDVCNLDFGVH